MAEKRMCEYCKKNEVSTECHECHIALCDSCAREIILETSDPASKIKGISTAAMGSDSSKRIVCPKCMKEVDVF